ncbi:unnamed protein product [Effrenium voratum]|uniref:Uncharacterized protein n=1 Tax=Effrenium voratum TaxID=2562239 RepID=A0AA36MWP3_9DINO|nr:unnamed protein product [Effrenium voratum]
MSAWHVLDPNQAPSERLGREMSAESSMAPGSVQQRLGALDRARGLQQQLAEKACFIQEAAEREEAEAQQRCRAMADGRNRAQERSKALLAGLREVKQEVASLQWRVQALEGQGPLRRLNEDAWQTLPRLARAPHPGGPAESKVLQLRKRRESLEVQSRSCQEENKVLQEYLESQREAQSLDDGLVVKEALRAFAEGAMATLTEAFQEPLRRIVLLDTYLRALQERLQGGKLALTNACGPNARSRSECVRGKSSVSEQQELLSSGRDLLSAFAAAVDAADIWELQGQLDPRSQQVLCSQLLSLWDATRRWRARYGTPKVASFSS